MSTLTQDQSACVLCPKTCSGISDEVSEDAEAGEEESTKFRLKRRTDGIKRQKGSAVVDASVSLPV